jgi:hypothetical protein
MKNLFRLGFLALAISLSLSSCDFFSNSKPDSTVDSNKIDSSQIDSTKIDSVLVDTAKIKANSTTLGN